jgi:glycine/D-amino acid oxidase-like deaminating enzyme
MADHYGERHAASWYAANLGETPRRPALAGSAETETAIIGGGLAGLTTAWQLAAAGRDVTLVEANRIGWGASGRNAGFVAPGFAENIFAIERRVGKPQARQLYDLSRAGGRFVHERLADLDMTGLIGGHGWLKVVRHPDTSELEERAARMARNYDVDLALWPRQAVRETLVTERYFGALHDSEPFHIDPLAYAVALADDAQRRGAALHDGTLAVSLERSTGGWRIGTSGENGPGALDARHVVLAGSAYQGLDAPALWPGLERAVVPVATYIVTTMPLGERLDAAIRFAGCIADTRRAGNYYRIVGSGDDRRLMWGGRITTARHEPARLAAMLKADMAAIYPQLGDAGIETAWSGLMGYQRTKMPIIGRIAGARDAGLWALTAFGGHGMNTTAMGGGLIAGAIVGNDDSWRLFEPWHPGFIDRTIGGRNLIGQTAAQLVYWGMQARDRFEERRTE